LAGFDLRDVEHIVDQAQQMFAILLDALQNFQRLVRQRAIDASDELVGHALAMDTLASADSDFLNGMVIQLANASSHDQELDERGLNFMLSVIKGIEPRDRLESMLAARWRPSTSQA
jgi:xylose isomerase